MAREKVQMTLTGLDGNAFSLLGAFRKSAARQGWTEKEIQVVLNEAMADNYDHLVNTLMDNIEETD